MASVAKRTWTYKGEEKSAWVVRYTDQEGKLRQKTFQMKKMADKYRLKVETELDNGTHVSASASCTILELATQFANNCERRRMIGDRMTRTTVKSYEGFLFQHIAKRFGGLKVVDVTANMIQDWLNLLCKSFKRRTVDKAFQIFKLMLAFGVRSNRIGRNVIVEGGVRVPYRPKERVAVPSIEEVKQALRDLEKRDAKELPCTRINRKVVVYLALFGGMRRGEIAGLDWENVDLANGVIHIVQSYSPLDGVKPPKTHAGIRDLQVPPQVLDVLLEARAFMKNPEAGPVILGRFGKRTYPQQIWRLWATFAKRAGLVAADGGNKYTFHALRHVAASLLIADGLTPFHIKTYIGHSNISTTMNVYGHLFPEDTLLREGVRKASERVFGVQGLRITAQPIEIATL